MKIMFLALLICCIAFIAVPPVAFESQIRNQQNTQTHTIQNTAQVLTVEQPSINQTQNVPTVENNPAENPPNQNVIFHMEPENLTVNNGDVFNITVIADAPANPGMVAAEFHLSWDPSVLNGLSVIKVLFQNNSIGWDELNSSQGILTCVHALCSGLVTGNQTLAIVTFQAVNQGSTILHFTFVAACSPDAHNLSCESFDGNISVEAGNGTAPAVSSSTPANALYTMTITAGSPGNGSLIPPADASLNVPFNVNVEIVNVTNMSGWEFGLTWNNSALYCTNVEIYNPPSWQSSITIDGQINNNYSSTQGSYHIAIANPRSYSGNITIATLTFKPLATGTAPLTFDFVAICDANCANINYSTTTGSVTIH